MDPLTPEELAFADQVGRHFARHYGMPPATGRVAGYLLICDPPEQTAAEIAEALNASRSAVGNAVSALETFAFVVRTRAAGERADRIALNPDLAAQGIDTPDENAAMLALAQRGLEILGGASAERRQRLQEVVVFYEWWQGRMSSLVAEWREHLAAIRAEREPPPDA